MTTTPVRHRRSAAPRAILVGLVTAVALLLGTSAASAHDTVIGTAPGDGETLTTAPTQVTVETSAVPQSIGSRMVITASDGTVLFDGEPTITDRVASVELPAVANDSYQVAWRLVSSDGHPIDGTFGFVVDDPAAVTPTEDPTSDAATPTADETTVAATTDAAPSEDSTTATAADTSDDGSSTSWIPVALIVVVIVGLVLLVLFRRRSALQDNS
ncbi:copper resistance CopC family protein [Sanguibacter inulinus]|uniref:Copper resistance protein CopC n=1 Tax=Sanguibacter inulinus TaxID=60922 RepID=A0A853EYR5_9MICO|nr:copper resistance CopC family protein [Sanguibacter inulinus]MBF0723849.1 copper resistance protein CopC [Sanguibacter inulinus]NYS94994.1 copper resistance protein CopC [Sanguibacter inulinus]